MSDTFAMGAGILGLCGLGSVGLLATSRSVPPMMLFGFIAGAVLIFISQQKKPEPVAAEPKKKSKQAPAEKKVFVPKNPTPAAAAPAAAAAAEPELSKKQKLRLVKKRKEEEAAAEAAAAAAAAKKDKKKGKKGKDAAPAAAVPAAAAAPAKATKAEEEAAKDAKKKKKPKKKEEKPPTPSASEDEEEAVVDGWAVAHTKTELRRAKKKETAVELGIDTTVPPVTERLKVADKHYSAIIGQKGATLQEIQKATSTKITMPKKNTGDTSIVFEGPAEGVIAAKKAIAEIVDKGYSTVTNPGMTDSKMEVPANKLGVVIGSAGATLKLIQEKTGTRINLPAKGTDSNEVTILGDGAGVIQARRAIEGLIRDGFCDLTHEGFTKMAINFPAKLLSVLIGPGGATIKLLQERTNTRINMPKSAKREKGEPPQEGNLEISIIGPVADAHRAAMEIRQIQADFIRDEIEYPDSLVNALIGGKGENIRKLQTKTGCKIDIQEHDWDPTLKAIGLEGIKSAVDSAKQEILAIVASQKKVEVEFPSDKIGTLLGAKGETIKSLQANNKGVRINVADHDWDSSVKDVAIDGPRALVDKVVAEIEKLKIKANEPPQKREPKEKAEVKEE